MTNELTTVPSYIQKYQGESRVMPIDQKEIQIYYIMLAQALSSAVQDQKIKVGHIYDTLSQTDLGKEISFTVVHCYVDWKLFDDNMKLQKISKEEGTWNDGTPFEKDQEWECKFYNFFVLVDGLEAVTPFVLSFYSSSAKIGKSLLNLIVQFSNAQNLPPYVYKYKVTTTETEAKGKTFYKYKSVDIVKDASGQPVFNSEAQINKAIEAEKFANQLLKINSDKWQTHPPVDPSVGKPMETPVRQQQVSEEKTAEPFAV